MKITFVKFSRMHYSEQDFATKPIKIMVQQKGKQAT
jgi:hypothetical protein